MESVTSVKHCCTCKEPKDISEFYVDRSRGGHQPRCISCSKDRSKFYEALRPPLSPLQSRDKHLRQRYGFDHEEYCKILEAQNHLCAVCLSDNPGKGFNYFHIDHDHATGQIRGLLCARCNQALGLLKEDVSIILRAVGYLEKARG